MQVAGIRRLGAQVEMIEVGEPRPLAGDEVLLEVRAAGVAVCRKSPAIHATLCGRRRPALTPCCPAVGAA
jgi:hypothetical protein